MLRGVAFFLSDRRILDPVGFKFLGEPHDQSAIGLGVCWLPGVLEASQEVSIRNRSPCLRNRLLPKSFHSALGVMGLSDTVPVDLKYHGARDR